MKHTSKSFILTIISIILILSIFNIHKSRPIPEYKILKVISTDEFYIDFNRNNTPDSHELVKLYDIEAFPIKYSKNINFQSKITKLNKAEIVAIGYLGKEFSKKTFTNQKVKVIFYNRELNKNKPYTQAKVLLDGEDIAKILLNQGFATPNKNEKEYKKELNFVNLHKQLQKAKKENILILNSQDNTYHNLECPSIQKIKYPIAIKLQTPPQNNIQNCEYPLTHVPISHKIDTTNFIFKNFDLKSGALNFYFTDFNKRLKPDNNCETSGCKILLEKINSAKESIEFAIFGIANQPQIINALLSAQNRGVKIRWVTDSDTNGNNIYKEITQVQKLLPNYKTDNHIHPKTLDKNYKYTNSIMHNKFFIFDKKSVWLGSANISHTDLADFNANVILFADSADIANIYLQEFEQMFNEKFHELKNPIHKKEQLKIDNENTISIYFSPTDKIITTKIIPEINKATDYIYISSFIITHKSISDSLISAKNRNVDIKIITDATSANTKYSIHDLLRANGISVKVENKAGKMHSKSMVIDGKLTILGSMNLTKSGENKNDENVIFIENEKIAKQFKNQFLYLWNTIPQKWLTKTPHAEGPDSIGSCSDKIDNDFDEDTDEKDSGCNLTNN